MAVNKVILVGHLGAEPESRAFPNGGSVCNLRLATSESWKDKQTGERKTKTEWHRVILGNKLGEIAQQYLHKGSQIYIEGSINTRKWQDKDGQEKYSTEIRGSQMRMLDSKGGGTDGGDQSPPQAPSHTGAPQSGADYSSGNDFDGSDIPFACHMKSAIV